MKQGQGRTFWIIIIAVIALITAVILIVMFTTKAGETNKSLSDCEGKGGICIDKVEGQSNPCKEGTLPATIFKCVPDTKVCCIGLGG